MISAEKKIEILGHLSPILNELDEDFGKAVESAYQHNKWFTKPNTLLAIKNIREQFLEEKKLERWLSGYDLKVCKPVNVGIVMAGNIPLVGFHDFLCVFMSDHKAIIKLSSKDHILFPFILKALLEIEPALAEYISVSEIIKGMDAVIATGSNNSSRYFEYYFGKYPHIIRKNRSSVAVLSGDESQQDLESLGTDIFTYFGLGCRNVSKLYVPAGYSFELFFQAVEKFRTEMTDHNKYKNNYDYNRVLLLMNHTPFLTNDFMILTEDRSLTSPVATLHYEFYSDETDLHKKLEVSRDNIQCIAGNDFLPFGTTQSPGLMDYADGVDTMEFLTQLK